jgi:hypothetical protein
MNKIPFIATIMAPAISATAAVITMNVTGITLRGI